MSKRSNFFHNCTIMYKNMFLCIAMFGKISESFLIPLILNSCRFLQIENQLVSVSYTRGYQLVVSYKTVSYKRGLRVLSSNWIYFTSSCFEANLNGEYHVNPKDNDYYRGIIWELWKGDYSLKSAKMMIRSKAFNSSSVLNHPHMQYITLTKFTIKFTPL